MNVYVLTVEDNLPLESSFGVNGVYQSFENAKAQLGTDYHDMIKECDSGNFMPRYFKEYTTIEEDGYWEIRSKYEEGIYMSEGIEEFPLE